MVFPEGAPPGVGVAAAKTAMETAVKRASLENMVKMIEREWVRVVVLCWGSSLESKIRSWLFDLKNSP